MIRLRDITATGWLAVACLALALILLTMCVADDRQKAADRARQAEAHKTLADGRTAAARDASAIRDRADARDQQIDQSTQETTDAIRHAPDDAAAGDHGLRSLCRLYPDRDPRCRMQQPSPGRVGPSAAFPQDAASVRDWQVFGVEQSGQLAKANGRTADVIGIVQACEARDAEAVERIGRPWLARLRPG